MSDKWNIVPKDEKQLCLPDSVHVINSMGKKLCKTKKMMKDFSEFMADPVAEAFVDKYFTDWNDIKVIIMYIKMYQFLQTRTDDSKEQLKPEGIAYLLYELINNTEYRKNMVSEMTRFMNT